MRKDGIDFMKWPKFVHIKEVGPRDGLQNVKEIISTEDKITWINMISETGVSNIEITSFVSPKWIPALRDALEVCKGIKRNPDVTYSALVPNLKGLENALHASIDEAAVFMSASETHNLKNINKSIAETFPLMKELISEAKSARLGVTGYVSTVFDCPYEGKTSPDQVLHIMEKLMEYGVDYIALGDTIGSCTPTQTETLLEQVLKQFPKDKIIMHYHDTHGMAIANILIALEMGITHFDSSIGGLGGCPYAPGAKGNVATDDIIYLLHRLGIKTNISEDKVFEATEFIQSKFEEPFSSKVFNNRNSAN